MITSCGGDDEDGASTSSNGPNQGINNTTDMAVTSGVKELGMTYADVNGFLNKTKFYNELKQQGGYFYVGIEYGESKNSFTQHEDVESTGDRAFTITLKKLEANKTYYYRSYVDWGYSYESAVRVGTAEEIQSFTTKDASFSGSWSTGDAKNVTFLHATIAADANTRSLNAKETYVKGMIYSSQQSELKTQLSTRLKKASQEAIVENGNSVVLVQSGEGYEGGYVDGELHFVISVDNEKTLTMAPGSKAYYCPFIIISNKSFIGDIKEVQLRTPPQQTGFVDLGLSCQWAACNIGAETSFDMGLQYTSTSSAESKIKSQFGEAARLPTREEAEELNRCKIEEIDNGVLITGPNGNQLFLPDSDWKQASQNSVLTYNYYFTSSIYSKNDFGDISKYNVCYFYNYNDKQVKFHNEPILSYPYNMNQKGCFSRAVIDGGSGGGGTNSSLLDQIEGSYYTYDIFYSDNDWYIAGDSEGNAIVYDVTIRRKYSDANTVVITGLWRYNNGVAVEGEFDETTGNITIANGQVIETVEKYGDLWFEGYKGDYITLKYYPEDMSYGSSMIVARVAAGVYDYFYVEMYREYPTFSSRTNSKRRIRSVEKKTMLQIVSSANALIFNSFSIR
jgi:hypothetical protein